MPEKILILGAGGHGKVVLDLIEHLPEWEIVALLDDDPEKLDSKLLGYPVLGPICQLPDLASAHGVTAVAVALGNNEVRRKNFDLARRAGLDLPRLIHPSAVISRYAELGAGAVVLAGVVVNTGAVIGENVCLNTACSIDHDCHLGDHSHIFPKAVLTGGVEIGEAATVGANAVVNPHTKIDAGSFVGSGAVVTRDVAAGEVVVGNPARPLRRRSCVASETVSKAAG